MADGSGAVQLWLRLRSFLAAEARRPRDKTLASSLVNCALFHSWQGPESLPVVAFRGSLATTLAARGKLEEALEILQG